MLEIHERERAEFDKTRLDPVRVLGQVREEQGRNKGEGGIREQQWRNEGGIKEDQWRNKGGNKGGIL